jgi:hypothetical protein
LLLVDHIFDWARDVYQEDIIKELKVLSSGENNRASLVCTNTDIFSTRQVELLEYSRNEVRLGLITILVPVTKEVEIQCSIMRIRIGLRVYTFICSRPTVLRTSSSENSLKDN